MKIEAVPNGVCELHLGGIDSPQRGQSSEVGNCFILHYFTDLYFVAHHLTSPIITGSIPWSLESKFISNHFNLEVLWHARSCVWGRRVSSAEQHWVKIPSIHKSSEYWGPWINFWIVDSVLRWRVFYCTSFISKHCLQFYTNKIEESYNTSVQPKRNKTAYLIQKRHLSNMGMAEIWPWISNTCLPIDRLHKITASLNYTALKQKY